jgi:hypothetical protein
MFSKTAIALAAASLALGATPLRPVVRAITRSTRIQALTVIRARSTRRVTRFATTASAAVHERRSAGGTNPSCRSCNELGWIV